MKDTAFRVPPEKVSRYAKALPNDPDTGKPQSITDSTQALKFECGGGCAVSTAADYIRFAQMMLNRGRLENTPILGRKSVELMTSDHLGPEIRSVIPGYGFGFTVAVRRQPGIAPSLGSEGDYFWGGAWGTYFWVDPREELVAVWMAHTPGPIRSHYTQVIRSLIWQALID
jgi:CubicO group peptidase (beta-lactamase class C family)